MKPTELSTIMIQAWKFVKITRQSLSECLRKSWANYKLKQSMLKGIVKFYYQKVDGTVREAYGTLKNSLLPIPTETKNKHRHNNALFTYFDTEKQEFRSFKKLNLVR